MVFLNEYDLTGLGQARLLPCDFDDTLRRAGALNALGQIPDLVGELRGPIREPVRLGLTFPELRPLRDQGNGAAQNRQARQDPAPRIPDKPWSSRSSPAHT